MWKLLKFCDIWPFLYICYMVATESDFFRFILATFTFAEFSLFFVWIYLCWYALIRTRIQTITYSMAVKNNEFLSFQIYQFRRISFSFTYMNTKYNNLTNAPQLATYILYILNKGYCQV